MRVSQLCSERYIKIGFDSRTKDDLFRELVYFLADREPLDTDAVLRSLWDRERMLNTRLIPNVALPHTQAKGLTRTVGVLAIDPAGCAYELPGEELVKVVMLVIDSTDATIEHLDTLRNFALLCRKPRFLPQLLECKDAATVLKTLKAHESYID